VSTNVSVHQLDNNYTRRTFLHQRNRATAYCFSSSTQASFPVCYAMRIQDYIQHLWRNQNGNGS